MSATAIAPARIADPLEVTAGELADGLWEIVPVELPPRYDGRPQQRISASSINAFALCPEAFRRRYLLGQRHPATPAMFIGRAVDETFNTVFRGMLDGSPALALDQVEDIYNDQFAAELVLANSRDGIAFDDDLGRDECFDIGRSLVQVMHERLLPVVGRPVSVQREFRLKLAPHLQWEIVGTMDLEASYRMVTCLDDDGEVLAEWCGDEPEPELVRAVEGPLRTARHKKRPIEMALPASLLAAQVIERRVTGIDDIKAKDRAIDATKAKSDIQAGLYLTNAWLKGEHRDRFRWLQGLKPGPQRQEAAVSVVSTTRSDGEMRALLVRIAELTAHINDLYRSRGPDRMWPLAPAGSWKCTQRFCDHFRERTCPMAGL